MLLLHLHVVSWMAGCCALDLLGRHVPGGKPASQPVTWRESTRGLCCCSQNGSKARTSFSFMKLPPTPPWDDDHRLALSAILLGACCAEWCRGQSLLHFHKELSLILCGQRMFICIIGRFIFIDIPTRCCCWFGIIKRATRSLNILFSRAEKWFQSTSLCGS